MVIGPGGVKFKVNRVSNFKDFKDQVYNSKRNSISTCTNVLSSISTCPRPSILTTHRYNSRKNSVLIRHRIKLFSTVTVQRVQPLTCTELSVKKNAYLFSP